MIEWAKRAARLLLGEYSIYCIYRTMGGAAASVRSVAAELSQADISECPDPLLRNQAGYAGEGARAFGLREQGRLQALCFYWEGERYRRRNFWPLKPGEAKLVQIVTAEDARGRGLARQLIASSAAQLLKEGKTALYARIWHSNLPSIRAFEAAGWERVALVVEVNPLRLARPWRWQRAVGPAAQ